MMMGVMAMADRGVGVMEGARHIAIGLQANDFTMVMRRFLVVFGGETMMIEERVIGGHSDVSPVWKSGPLLTLEPDGFARNRCEG